MLPPFYIVFSPFVCLNVTISLEYILHIMYTDLIFPSYIPRHTFTVGPVHHHPPTHEMTTRVPPPPFLYWLSEYCHLDWSIHPHPGSSCCASACHSTLQLLLEHILNRLRDVHRVPDLLCRQVAVTVVEHHFICKRERKRGRKRKRIPCRTWVMRNCNYVNSRNSPLLPAQLHQ